MSDPIVGPGGAAIIGSIGTILIGLSAQWVIRRNKKDEVHSVDKKNMDEIYTALVQGNLSTLIKDVSTQKARIKRLEKREQKRALRQNKILLSIESFKTQVVSLKVRLTTYLILKEAGREEVAELHFVDVINELDTIVADLDGLAAISDIDELPPFPTPEEKEEEDESSIT